MKAPCFTLVVLLVGALLANTTVDASKVESRGGDRTITKVVKLLQRMLKKSAKEADDDKEAYAKYKCYVDTNEAEKKESIATLARAIETLESKIAELQAENAELMQQTATLSTDMRANKAAQKSATAVRKSSKESFDLMEEDLEKGIGQMKEAIDVLTSIGLSQNEVNVHKKEAALLSLGSKVRESLLAASALLSPEKRQILEGFLQAPLSAAHSTQGDAITGVLKTLKSTFEGNLKNARDSEKAEKKAFEESIDVLDSSWKTMEKSLKEKEDFIGSNYDELGSASTALDKSIKQKAEDEAFLEKLLEMAATKAKNYEERKMLRANEDAAIAQCISILNSDEAFSTFGTTDATTSGGLKASFLQLRQLRGGASLQQAETVLEQAAAKGHSTRLAHVASRLRAGHAFTSVLDEIEKMKKTIAEEGQADKEELDWCKKERTNSNKDLDAKKSSIKTLKAAIEKLDETINKPETGLIDLIAEKETSLVENQKAQVDQTKTRNEENAAYQEDVSNLSDAEDILAKAIKVLKRYYDQLDKHLAEGGGKAAFVQLQEDPKPPETYDDFEGQKGKGNEAIDMLEFILKETKKEHTKADDDESSAQSDFDDSMKKLKQDQADMQKALVDLKADLTAKLRELEEKRSDLKDTTAAKEAIEKYLEDIKPGCDFITENFDVRETNRATETTALNKAKGLIKDTPAYKAAVARDAELAAGKCNSECKLDSSSLRCKACVAGSSKADFCKSNPGQAGCK